MQPDKQTDTVTEATRTLRIDVRVSAEEKRVLLQKAKDAGYKKVSAYLRDVGQGAEVKQVVPPELRRQLVSIGTNLNQLVLMAQSGNSLGSHEAQLLQALAVIKSCLV